MALAEGGANFTKGNLFRHVSVMSLTSSISLMAIFVVDLMDIVFISMLGTKNWLRLQVSLLRSDLFLRLASFFNGAILVSNASFNDLGFPA